LDPGADGGGRPDRETLMGFSPKLSKALLSVERLFGFEFLLL
jgi:hypothetical protein